MLYRPQAGRAARRGAAPTSEVINDLLRRLGSDDPTLSTRPTARWSPKPSRRSGYRRARRDRKDRLHRPRPRPMPTPASPMALPGPTGAIRFAPELAGRRGQEGLSSGSAIPPRCRASPTTGTSPKRSMPTHPFRLATSPARGFLNSSFHRNPRQPEARRACRRVLIHPDDAARLGIAEGERVTRRQPARRGGADGAISSTACRRGVLIAEGIHPNKAHRGGKGINTLIGSDPVAPFGGAAFHDTRGLGQAQVVSRRRRPRRTRPSAPARK